MSRGCWQADAPDRDRASNLLNSLRRRLPRRPCCCSVGGSSVAGKGYRERNGMRTGAVSAGAAVTALVNNSHLCHLPEVNEQLVRSGPSMFHVKPGGESFPCSIERHAGWASRQGDKRAEDSGHRMEIDAQSSIRQRDYVPVDASSPATWQSGSAMAPSVVTAMPVDWDCVRMQSFDQGSTVCIKRFQPSLGGNRPAAMAPLCLAAQRAASALCDHIRLCRCEAEKRLTTARQLRGGGASSPQLRTNLGATVIPVASPCGVTYPEPLRAPYCAADALCGRVVD